LKNVYSAEIQNLYIIDCRYPYEYEGGHIQSARNLYTRTQIYNEFFRQPMQLKDPLKRNIFIFHCEFSSERAPSL
jgi:rhodanese-related sulfurtransferase